MYIENLYKQIELTGILIPCFHELNQRIYRFKLGTETNELFLHVREELIPLARAAAWEEVTVKGKLDVGQQILEVEKIKIVEPKEPVAMPLLMQEACEFVAS